MYNSCKTAHKQPPILRADAQPRRNTKKRLPISIRFALRPGWSTLQIRITVNGNEGSAFSTLNDGTTLSTEGLVWNQPLQQAEGRSVEAGEFNLLLARIRTDIHYAYQQQVERGHVPTAKSVKAEYQNGTAYTRLGSAREHKWSVTGCYRAYLSALKKGEFSEKVLHQTTLDKWGYGLTYLEAYVEATSKDEPLCLGIADQITQFWAKSYHRWLMKNGPMSADSATRYVNRLIEAISYVAEMGAIRNNPLATLSLPRGKTKDVHFLEPDHLDRFWALNLPGKAGLACWWMGVIFLTGLDYRDAVSYVQNRKQYERPAPGGRKIVINRSKPPLAECHIPILPRLEALLSRPPIGPPPADWEVNREMRAVATLISFPHRLTCKVGRKTAGSIFYATYKDIGGVSRILGHGSVSMTERCYVRTTGHTVDAMMEAVNGNEQPPIEPSSIRRLAGTPFTHVA